MSQQRTWREIRDALYAVAGFRDNGATPATDTLSQVGLNILTELKAAGGGMPGASQSDVADILTSLQAQQSDIASILTSLQSQESETADILTSLQAQQADIADIQAITTLSGIVTQYVNLPAGHSGNTSYDSSYYHARAFTLKVPDTGHTVWIFSQNLPPYTQNAPNGMPPISHEEQGFPINPGESITFDPFFNNSGPRFVASSGVTEAFVYLIWSNSNDW